MFKTIINQIKPAVFYIVLFTIITGLIYPALITGIAQLIFPWRANGSILIRNGQAIGSYLIGQSSTEDHYFHSRPSATLPFPYNGEASAGSNFGPSNVDFLEIIKERVRKQQNINHNNQFVPADLVTASASGLDPDISPLSAYYQISRIAKLRNISDKTLKNLVDRLIQARSLKILGEPRINVLTLNLALDELSNNLVQSKNNKI